MKIFKYPLVVTDEQQILLPPGSRILSVAEQFGTLCAWALVDATLSASIVYTFRIVGTGNPMPLAFRKLHENVFVGSVVMTSGFVWHVFHDLVDEVN